VFSSGISAPLLDTLLTQGDHYMHLEDLTAYLEADRKLVERAKFSSDRTIAEYAGAIWHSKACSVE
jgi:starch phosphorylase